MSRPRSAVSASAKKPAESAKATRVAPVTIKSILSQSSNVDDRLIPELKHVAEIIADLKRMGYRIVLTQGVYDMIHEGHARYLERARSLGDILILGVDSDELTRGAKVLHGPSCRRQSDFRCSRTCDVSTFSPFAKCTMISAILSVP